MYSHETKLRVRYAETDQMGYLYYGNYAQYYEVGRVEMLRSLGLSYKKMEEEHGIMMPVMSLNQRFIRPAYYDNELSIITSLRRMPEREIVFHVEIKNELGKLLNGGTVKLCFVDMVSKKSIPTPKFLIEALEPFFK